MIHTLEADGIQLDFGLRSILSDVYIKCETGKITGLLGRNGQGKTCLMNVILGTLNSSINSVRFDGNMVRNASKRPDLLLYLPQFNFIPKTLTVKKVMDDFQLSPTEFERRFPEFNSRYDLKVNQLSGGQWRTLELYIIVKTPSLFAMLDEPFTHLNPIQIDNIKEFLVEEKANKGMLITDHMYSHLLDISDSVYLLKDGKTHQAKTLDDLDRLGYVRLDAGR
ncbi:ATP-binding cassette domain-containing protein [Mucilaginibacter sp.]|uniref:ATP-binding cassette domain-containing protein n=1 Tax=Mucilaginibacter sp. TaxID=1882438 RepID=UPI003D0B2FA4